jgi:hypothetical protein
MGWMVNSTPRPLYPRERDPVPIVQEAGWTSVNFYQKKRHHTTDDGIFIVIAFKTSNLSYRG